ncbi:MAG: adenylate kinase [Candidatus Marinamargulisbacteria bacterium]
MSSCITFLGAPGSGKGTQAERLSEKLGMEKISVGDLVREEVLNESPLGKQAKPFIEAGNLVPDELIIGMFEEKAGSLSKQTGFIADGYPRNLDQAKALDGIIDAKNMRILLLDVSVDAVKKRLLGRLICGDCQKIFHRTFSPPAVPSVCDACGGALKARSDDNEVVIENRFRVYENEMASVFSYFGNRVKRIDANQGSDNVFAAILRSINGH